MKITEFGKILRKIRIDHDEVLKDMAVNLGKSSSYLSAIEVGKRSVPATMISDLQTHYSLDEKTVQQLKEAVEKDKKSVKIMLQDVTPKKRDLALVFSRRFESMDGQTVDSILQLLNKEKR